MPTLFHEPWWLSAASAGTYDEVSFSLGGRVVGRMPFLPKRRFGMNTCELPDLTHFLGPAVDEGNGSPGTRALRRAQITRELIRQLPQLVHFAQRFHRGVPDTLPFLNEGFHTDAVFTYELPPAAEDSLWRGMRDKTRNVIRRAQEQTELVDLDPAEFARCYEANLQVRGLFNHQFDATTGPRVFATALEHGRGRLLGARTADRTIAAAIFYAWDRDVTYYVLTTRTPEAHNGAVSRLIWEAIRDSAANNRTFDFDGVGSAGTSLLYPGFGGKVCPRYYVHRTSQLYATARYCFMTARDAVRSARQLAARRGGGSSQDQSG